MSSGEIHYKYYMRGYREAIPLSIVFSFVSWKFGAGYISGYSLHRYVDNDWDLMGTSKSEGRMVNELPLLGHYLFGVSSMYGSAFRKWHRSIPTHVPVISTLGRLIVVFIAPFTYLDAWGINFIGNGWVWYWLGLWAGLSHADGIHYYLDLFPRTS